MVLQSYAFVIIKFQVGYSNQLKITLQLLFHRNLPGELTTLFCSNFFGCKNFHKAQPALWKILHKKVYLEQLTCPKVPVLKNGKSQEESYGKMQTLIHTSCRKNIMLEKWGHSDLFKWNQAGPQDMKSVALLFPIIFRSIQLRSKCPHFPSMIIYLQLL